MRDRSLDLVHHFADLAAETVWADISRTAIDAAKKSVLDTLAVSLAASGLEPLVRSITDYVRDIGGRAESSVLASQLTVPAPLAAFANGAMAHCLDYDDLTVWGHHAASSVIPTVLALAQRCGGVSGRELIIAVAVAQDIFARLRCHVEWRKDWNISPVMGVFAATAAGSRVLGFTPERTAHAVGIAAMYSSGTMQVVQEPTDLRGIYAGFSAQGAVTAVLLAARGITGLPSLFEGRFGIMNTYFGGRYDRDKILDGLGEEYLGSATLYKRWPSVSTSHSHIHATVEVLREHEVEAADIDEIRIFVGDWHEVMCRPLEARRAPTTALGAKFSLPFLVASAAVRGEIGVSDFTDAALANPAVLDLARRIVPVPDPSLDWNLEIPAGRVEIVTRDGRCLTATGRDVPGTVAAPLTWTDLERKFDDCAAAGAVRLSSSQVDRVKTLAQNLESLDDATELIADLG